MKINKKKGELREVKTDICREYMITKESSENEMENNRKKRLALYYEALTRIKE